MAEPNGAATVSPRPLVRLPSTGFEAKGVVMTAEEIDRYLAGVEEPTRGTLEEMRRRILEVIPDAEQCLSYVCTTGLQDARQDGRRTGRVQEPSQLPAA